MVIIFSLLSAVFFIIGLSFFIKGNGRDEIYLFTNILFFLLCLGFAGVIAAINRVHGILKVLALQDKGTSADSENKSINPNKECICTVCGQTRAAIAMKNLENGKGICQECYSKNEGKW